MPKRKKNDDDGKVDLTPDTIVKDSYREAQRLTGKFLQGFLAKYSNLISLHSTFLDAQIKAAKVMEKKIIVGFLMGSFKIYLLLSINLSGPQRK